MLKTLITTCFIFPNGENISIFVIHLDNKKKMKTLIKK